MYRMNIYKENMKNLFILFLFYLIKKPIKIRIMDVISKYYVSDIEVSKSWDGVETINVKMKTLDDLKRH